MRKCKQLKHAGLVVVTLVLSLSLPGCALLRPMVMPTSPQDSWPTPSELGYSLQAQQVLGLTYQGQTHKMSVALEVSAQKMTLVAISAVGVPIAIINWDGEHLDKQSPTGMDLNAIPFELIMDTIFYAYWPQPSLADMLKQQQWTMTATAQQRSLYNHQQQSQIDIRFNQYQRPNGSIAITDYRTGLDIALTTIQWITTK
ncbi:DUF3261 domain-containing protein [Shewanella intestini]|nr:DUF3261 domain-containing protein [Shewanella intestini]